MSVENASLVTALCRYLERNCARPVPLAELAREALMSPRQVARLFRQVVGITPREYAECCRVERFKSELRGGESVTGATYAAGFSSSSRVYEKTDTQLGMTPRTYQSGGDGKRVTYTIASSPLGRLLVASTDRGVCAVYLGDDDDALRTSLEAEFHAADIERDDRALTQLVETIFRSFTGADTLLEVPLDVRATAFQRRVWRALQQIPFGATRSYSEIAAAIGKPSATRAVARACATNPVSLVVPCHRVVRGDGSLAGYRWGIDRKRELLRREAEAVEMTRSP